MAEAVSVSLICRIEWKVKDVLSVPEQESGQFAFKGSLWKLVLDKVKLAEGIQFIRVYLEEVKREKIFDDFASRAFIVGRNYTPYFLSERLCRRPQTHYCNFRIWCVEDRTLMKKEDILSTEGDVSFVCILMPRILKEEEDRGNTPVQLSTNAKAGGSVEAHLLDFRRLLEDCALSDVTLKCEDCTFPAHRNILSARSEVFAAMLRADMSESRRVIIEISDMEPRILDQLLQFIYSCKLPDMSIYSTPQLYEAAVKYGVESLKEDCSAFMKENLSEENACSILFLADAHGDSDLKDCVVSFIVGKKLFLNYDIWPKFCEDHPKLANGVLNRACKTLVSCLV